MKKNPSHGAPADDVDGLGCGGALARVVTGARTATAASSDFERMWRDRGMTLKDMAAFSVPQASCEKDTGSFFYLNAAESFAPSVW